MTRRLTLIATAAFAGAYLWWRSRPSACPFALRIAVQVPHPLITRTRLLRVLEPQPGERVLEIGPGTGHYTLDIARRLGANGRLEIFDLQQEMLDHTMRQVRAAGLDNVVPTQGDARRLPYADQAFDAVILATVLGEIPDRAAALGEIFRVLKPGGRMVVGELALGDPHFVRFGRLRGECADAGLALTEQDGMALGYFARFERL